LPETVAYWAFLQTEISAFESAGRKDDCINLLGNHLIHQVDRLADIDFVLNSLLKGYLTIYGRRISA